MVVGFVCRQSLAGKDFQAAYTGLTPGLQFSMFYEYTRMVERSITVGIVRRP